MDKKKLDYFYKLINETVLFNQNTITGLIPASNNNTHAWVRDNVYAVLSVWGLSLAYRKVPDVDEDRSHGYELEKCVIKLMRGLLACLMRQSDKVERFKQTQNPLDSLHAKFDSRTCHRVVGDNEWGHLQIDAVSIFLLAIAQMTASGMCIIWTMEEVAFIQNLVFYIELAYRIPDYGIWERGDKTNHGLPELNASSVGMAKAALEAMSELDLFGAHGGPHSMIHVLADESQQCQAVLQSMLPRESNSKETDAALLGVISYPAFSVDDEELIEVCKKTFKEKLEGRYGHRRFLRDGYRTAREDPNRLHYEPWELRMFENIECEWPMFFTYLILDAHFNGDQETADKYIEALDKIVLKQESGLELIPESYSVLADRVDAEARERGSQQRIPVGKVPHIWGQSLYILAKMLHEGVLLPGEIDPLGRRMVTEPKPDLVVQVVVIAEDVDMKCRLREYQLDVQTFAEIYKDSGIKVFPAKVLNHFYKHLGKCDALNLSGRTTKEVGILATSKLYMVGSQTVAFTPQFSDLRQFYLALDVDLMMDLFLTELSFISLNWKILGRPIVLLPISKAQMEQGLAQDRMQEGTQPALISTIKKLQSGYINATRVKLGKLSEFVSTSCITKLSFIKCAEELLAKAVPMTTAAPHRRRLASGQFDGPPLQELAQRRVSMRKKSVALTSAVSFDLGASDEEALGRHRKLGQVSDPNMALPTNYWRRGSFWTGLLTSMQNAQPDGEEEEEEEDGQVKGGDIRSPNMVGLQDRFWENPPFSDEEDEVHRKKSNVEADAPIGKPLKRLKEVSHHLRSPAIRENLQPSQSSEFLRKLMTSQSKVGSVDQSQTSLDVNPDELVERLQQTEDMYEQADIIYNIYQIKGLDWNTGLDNNGCTVRDLLKEVYEKAGQMTQWSLVRFTAGLLRKRVEHLAKALTDILVRQKQVTVGLPPEPREKVIAAPLPPDKLAELIHKACGEDYTMAMLTQEILVYLSMFARTEPQLLEQMLRLRVGLIIQVMASELGRTLHCSAEDASMNLFNLSPCETKVLLHHLLSGKEFKFSAGLHPGRVALMTKSAGIPFYQIAQAVQQKHKITKQSSESGYVEDEDSESDRHGQWLRRRKIDGALNRVPPRFYQRLWSVLERSHGVRVAEQVLSQNLTKEMTPNETKFAMVVEEVMNNVPVPEYRQLLVEAMSVLCGALEQDKERRIDLNYIIPIDKMVHRANTIFLEDQSKFNGDATLCCAATVKGRRKSGTGCRGACYVCAHFYDTSPSGKYGTMTYLFRALSDVVHVPLNQDGDLAIDCVIQ